MTRISVVVPTYQRPDLIPQCLESLQRQQFRDAEVLLVDNSPSEALRATVEAFNERDGAIPVRYIPEWRVGLHNARHTAAHAARGDILVYTDDDATFDPGWLAAYVEAFDHHPSMTAAGGPVRPIWKAPPPSWLIDYMGDAKSFGILSLMEPYSEFRSSTDERFFGVNMAIRRTVLFDVGGFNPEGFGADYWGDGEVGLNQKLADAGMLTGYVPTAIVYHHVPPSRMTVDYFARANEGASAEYTRFRGTTPGLSAIAPRIALALAGLARVGVATVYRLLRRDPFLRLKLRMGINFQITKIRFLLRLLRDRELREMVNRTRWLDSV